MTTPLVEIQSLFQDRLLAGRADIEAHLQRGGPFLHVYDHAYEARLIEVMGEDFPAVHTLLGDDGFAEACSAYVRAHPSHARSIRWLGKDFAAWLRATDLWSDVPVVGDMAAFEWALGLAFDAPDGEALAAEALARVPPEAWPVLTFDLHPSLNVFQLSHDVGPFQQAVARDEDPDAAPEMLGERQIWAAWRDAETLTVRYRVLPTDEAAGLDVLRRGEEFQTLCQVLAEQGDPEDAALRAAGFLKHWLDAGWITGLSAEGMSWS
ncbi:MAG: DNA-binding domain-containing protein [Rhodospirillales bacterium]